MNLTLKRFSSGPNGIFSNLIDSSGKIIAVTLEHSYPMLNTNAEWEPKIPNGIYKCVRGMHMLHNDIPFQTFEVTGVAGHIGLLFHVGNYNRDSEGCILVGQQRLDGMITNSRETFDRFLEIQNGVEVFTLTVC